MSEQYFYKINSHCFIYKMVTKEGKVIAVGMLMVLFLIVGNSAYFLVKTEDSVGIMSGNSIKDVVGNFYRTSSVNQRIFILFQFFLLVLIIVVVLIIIKRLKPKHVLSKGGFGKKDNLRSGTDLDILYEMIKRDKEVSISDVGEAFNISPEVSLEWAKVLEDGDLAVIEYPRFGKPVLRLPTEKEGEGEAGVDKKVEGKKPLGEEERKGLQKVVMEKDVLNKVVPGKVAEKVEKEKAVLEKVGKKVENRKTRKMDKKLRKIDEKLRKLSGKGGEGEKGASKQSKNPKKK